MDDEDFLAFESEEVIGSSENHLGAPALLTTVPAPWLSIHYADRKVAPLIRLHNEILTFVEFITPTVMEYKLRDTVLSEITQIIKDIWPIAIVKIFGSQLTRILTPTSDLDLAMLNIPEAKTGERDPLDVLSDAILAKGIVTYCEVIHAAKVPIIKMDHKAGIAVDICCNNDSGLHTGAFIKQMVNSFPPLRPLTMLLKVFLAQRRLNETYTGGIGSFVLSSLLVSFLQQRIRLCKYRKTVLSWNLGSLLIDFLHLYGSTFNYVHTGISIAGNGSYFEKRKRSDGEWGPNSSRPNMLSIENPQQPELDMGRNSFMMPKIRRSFEHALQLLSAALANPDCESYLSFFIRTDDPNLAGRQANLSLSTRSRVQQQFVDPKGSEDDHGDDKNANEMELENVADGCEGSSDNRKLRATRHKKRETEESDKEESRYHVAKTKGNIGDHVQQTHDDPFRFAHENDSNVSNESDGENALDLTRGWDDDDDDASDDDDHEGEGETQFLADAYDHTYDHSEQLGQSRKRSARAKGSKARGKAKRKKLNND